MPADLSSTLVLILLNAADAVGRIWPYVLGGIGLAALLSRFFQNRRWAMPGWLRRPLAAPLAALTGVVSPLPTTAMVPLALRLQAEGLPAELVLTFVLASSLLNPQLFVLTLGALGARFALAQAAGVLLLSTGLGLALGKRDSAWHASGGRGVSSPDWQSTGFSLPVVSLAEHVALYVLVGVVAGACLRVLLPRLGVLSWLGVRGWLSAPVLGWLGAPFYTCGGSAVPLANSLGQVGFSPGMLFTFLLVGPALRGTTLANLGCLLSRRAQVSCLIVLALAGGVLGHVIDWLVI